MPRQLTTDEVLEILGSGEFNRLVGALEVEHLECKAAPYHLAQDHQKMEIAKDVSALANAEGGIILLGVETGRDALHHGDVVQRIRPFDRALLDIGQFEQVLGAWIYPGIRGLQIVWYPSAADARRGIVAVLIPNESSQDKPYLVGKVVETTRRVVGSYVGFFERRRDGVAPLSVQELRDRLKDGLRFSDLERRLESIEESVGRLTARPAGEAPPAITAAVIAERRSRARVAVGFAERPSFILAAWPLNHSRFPTLFESRAAEVVRLLENPTRLRVAGFDLSTRRQSEILDGELRRCVIPGSKLIELWRDGPLIFVSAGDGWHLCWGMESTGATGLRINNLALTETTYLFADLALKISAHSVPEPRGLAIALQLASMTVEGVPCSLNNYRPSPFTVDNNRRYAPEERMDITYEFEKENSDAGGISYQLLAELYAWFGFNAVEMPYVDRNGETPRIDPAQIA